MTGGNLERREALCIQILLNCRNELSCLLPGMEGAFAALDYCPERNDSAIGTDGASILFSPAVLTGLYAESPAAVRRGYLHMLLHCLFLHPFSTPGDRLWDLACDIAVERIICRAGLERLRTPAEEQQKQFLSGLDSDLVSAQQICAFLRQSQDSAMPDRLERLFRFDDHSRWTNADSRTWERILAYTRQNQGNRLRGTKAGTETMRLTPAAQSRRSYRAYLHRFMSVREEITPDPESFDYIYYHLGMEHYGNLPLIEDLEYREVNRLAELVIAVDTSGSCSKETVERFLSETFSIFQEKENFFREMKVYLIQCDCVIQEIAVIRSEEDWKTYSKAVTIRGRGGTDFSPVFRYVDTLIETGELRELKALLYFTDGDGAYPHEKPAYETAFVLLREAAHPELVPAWAAKLMID